MTKEIEELEKKIQKLKEENEYLRLCICEGINPFEDSEEPKEEPAKDGTIENRIFELEQRVKFLEEAQIAELRSRLSGANLFTPHFTSWQNF